MKISVIIPTYNRAHILNRALDSVLAQSHQAAEVIVVDDASTDGTAHLLSEYPQVISIQFDKNLGVSAARNVGIKLVTSEWIAFLDSDDAWLPAKLAKQVGLIENNPAVRFIHTDEQWIRNGRRVNAMNKHAKPDGNAYQASLALCCVSPSSALIHRSVFEACGVFDESLPACEDYDLWLRIFNRYEIGLVDEPLVVKYGGHDDQLSKKYWGMDRFRIKALSKMLQCETLLDQNRASTLAMLQTKCDILSNGARKRQQFEDANYYQRVAAKYARTENERCRA